MQDPNPQTKVKTKAKKRYLKAKKERRKRRKPEPGTKEKPVDIEDNPPKPAYLENDNDPTTDVIANGSLNVELSKISDDIPPRKRRRIDTAKESVDHEGSDLVAEQTTKLPSKSPSPPVALPLFPLPRRPDAPSKTTLALQGLDKALTQAESVDAKRVIPIRTTPGDASGDLGISEKSRKRLEDLGISELFAVQTAVIPFMLADSRQRCLYLPHNPPRDVCVSAPTGSGKTLAYVVPIVEILSPRTVTRLRALIVLPTRDLVTQVRETFEAVAKGRGLKIGTATGQHSFAHEQAQLVDNQSVQLHGGSSKVDVLICTPGRLIDHLHGTRNFSLQHLRFLVIDEADRLLAQSFQDWLQQILAATRHSSANLSGSPSSSGDPNDNTDYEFPYPDAISPNHDPVFKGGYVKPTDLDERTESSCQMLLFSATLTRDPAKISSLGLRDPKYFVVQGASVSPENGEGVLDMVMEKFTMPATLKEHLIVCESSQKPLMLFYLIRSLGVTNALVFTKSAESTTRLVRLFELMQSDEGREGDAPLPPLVMKAYSSDLSPGDRRAILENFKTQRIQVLVCSDLISRGIDISHVSHVVSYDAPIDFRKYVHRVGRTARAGKEGDAWTLVEEQEARHFKAMMRAAGHIDSLKRLRISEKNTAPLVSFYQVALRRLAELYSR